MRTTRMKTAEGKKQLILNNNKQQTTNNQQQTTNNKQQTTNNKQQQQRIEKHRLILHELRKNAFCQLFTKFNAPLIKRIDIPHNTLHKDFVLIKSYQRAQMIRSYFLQQNGVSGSVSFHASYQCKDIQLLDVTVNSIHQARPARQRKHRERTNRRGCRS